MSSYLESSNKTNCFGCGACEQICPKKAIKLKKDNEGFFYPIIDKDKCINCGLCSRVCYFNKPVDKNNKSMQVFGGYNIDWNIRKESTSGGAFSAIAASYCKDNYIIFGAVADKKRVYHTYIDNINELDIFRKSKYIQSEIGSSFLNVKRFLKDGKKVLFSGTPCQIAGLRKYLINTDTSNLLTVEVVCEGVPSPLYIDKYDQFLQKKYKGKIANIDYRFKDSHYKNHARWDFEVMKIDLDNNTKIKKDRWFNPFWKIWLNHLMSRPSCYECPFASVDRVADITLGDLWGVHIYCPDLYGHNGGSSLIIANTKKGKDVLNNAKKYLYGHELRLEDALKYQGPMRKCISKNELRADFMADLQNKDITYQDLISKWYKGPNYKLLYSKYIWGNRQKVFLWNIKNKISKGGKK